MSTIPFQAPSYHTLNPSINLRDAASAIEFYKNAFGAIERYRLPSPDGKIMHAELQFGDSILMCNDEMPDWDAMSAISVGGSATTLQIYVEDVDAVFAKAVSLGAEAIRPPMDMFWGDRSGMVKCPNGYKWSLATHIEDVTPEEIGKRAAAMFAGGECA